MQQEDGMAGRFLDCSELVIGACIEVHRNLGPGLLESAYEQCLALELVSLGLQFERQRPVPVVYKGLALDHGYRLDFVVAGQLVLEVKATEQLLPVHAAQVLTYLRMTGITTGLLVNFGAETISRGLSSDLQDLEEGNQQEGGKGEGQQEGERIFAFGGPKSKVFPWKRAEEDTRLAKACRRVPLSALGLEP